MRCLIQIREQKARECLICLELMKLIHIPARCVLYLRAGMVSYLPLSLIFIVSYLTAHQISAQKLKIQKILLRSGCNILINYVHN